MKKEPLPLTDRLRIGLLGGTFDPVHAGHLAIANSFLRSGEIDELWIIPSDHPPHKSPVTITDFRHRQNMLNLAFDRFHNVRVMDTELHLSKPGYTLQTVMHYQNTYPDYHFYWCIGSDSLNQFPTWFKYREILNRCTLLVAERSEVPAECPAEMSSDDYVVVNHSPVDISSTNIRKLLKSRIKPDAIPQNVYEYIVYNSLYSM